MRKILLGVLLVVFSSVNAQKIALLNLDFKQPIIYTDSVTVEQLSSGLFPVSINDFDTLYANLQYIHDMLSKIQRSKMKSFELHAGSTVISIARAPKSLGDRYLTFAKTKVGDVESKYNLAPIENRNSKNADKIEKIMAYMKTNKDLFKLPYEIHPKIYNVVVISE